MTRSESLKESTLQEHQKLEKTVILHLKNLKDKKEYADLLLAFYGFYLPTEKRILSFINTTHLKDLTERRKAEHLLNDVHSLTQHVEGLAECETIPEIDNLAQAAGAMYVLEGSTLGGQFISKMLNEKLYLNNESLRFFSGYRDLNKQKWLEFTAFLNEMTFSAKDEAYMHTAAKNTFALFDKWLKSRL